MSLRVFPAAGSAQASRILPRRVRTRCPGGQRLRGGLGDAAVRRGAHGLYAYPRRLCLWHAEPLEDVQGLPENDPRSIGLLRVERRFCDSFEDFGLLIRIADLPGQPESGVVIIKRLAVLAGSATHVGYPANCDHLLGQIPDLLGDRSRLLVINECLVIALRALVNGANVIKHVGLIREIPDIAVYGECSPAGG